MLYWCPLSSCWLWVYNQIKKASSGNQTLLAGKSTSTPKFSYFKIGKDSASWASQRNKAIIPMFCVQKTQNFVGSTRIAWLESKLLLVNWPTLSFFWWKKPDRLVGFWLKSPAAAPGLAAHEWRWQGRWPQSTGGLGFSITTVGKLDIIWYHGDQQIPYDIPHDPSWITMTLHILCTISISYFWYESLTWMKYTTSHLWG